MPLQESLNVYLPLPSIPQHHSTRKMNTIYKIKSRKTAASVTGSLACGQWIICSHNTPNLTLSNPVDAQGKWKTHFGFVQVQYGSPTGCILVSTKPTGKKNISQSLLYLRDKPAGDSQPNTLTWHWWWGNGIFTCAQNRTLDLPSKYTLRGNLLFTKRGQARLGDK